MYIVKKISVLHEPDSPGAIETMFKLFLIMQMNLELKSVPFSLTERMELSEEIYASC